MSESTPPRPKPKKVLVVTAHPDPLSLNAALARFAVEELRTAGHEVRVSDLYAMKWKAVVDADDFPEHVAAGRPDVLGTSQRATPAGRLAPEIAAEQEKLRWADAVILQFPMWWFGAPAILKGWFDRVFTAGFAYGPKVAPPYTEGPLGGRRALVSVTVGARETSFSDRARSTLPGDRDRLSDRGFRYWSGPRPTCYCRAQPDRGVPDVRTGARTSLAGRRGHADEEADPGGFGCCRRPVGLPADPGGSRRAGSVDRGDGRGSGGRSHPLNRSCGPTPQRLEPTRGMGCFT
ncbi:NAD(P)H dehydrogenase (quinone) [Embleya sp. AB8]